MEKNYLIMIVNDLRSRRDALSLAHEQLKSDSDSWNKCDIVISLGTGMFESAKIQMGCNYNIVALVPIALSSVIACMSALIKFRNFPSQMKIILKSQSLLIHTLTNARNENSITSVLSKEYNDALEKLETALYPDIRKQYLVQSHKNLISIMKQESKYFGLIELLNSGCEVNTSSGNSSPNPLDSGNTTPDPFEKPTPNPFGHFFEVDI
jgi:hypothetical protein